MTTRTTEQAARAWAAAPTTGLLLAAGGGRRLGNRPKALLPYRGRPLVEHAVAVLRAGGCRQVLVVLGAQAQQVLATADLTGCEVVVNDAWADGMGSSLRAGLRALPPEAGAALIGLVDTPKVTPAAVARVLAAAPALAAASYDGVRAHPVLIPRQFWPEAVAGAEGDVGARALLRAHAAELRLVDCADVAAPDDVDTPDQLARLLAADPWEDAPDA